MATIYYQKDCNLSLLEGKTIDPSLGQRQKQKDLKYIQQQRLLREQILS